MNGASRERGHSVASKPRLLRSVPNASESSGAFILLLRQAYGDSIQLAALGRLLALGLISMGFLFLKVLSRTLAIAGAKAMECKGFGSKRGLIEVVLLGMS